jgi:hypothetical protein
MARRRAITLVLGLQLLVSMVFGLGFPPPRGFGRHYYTLC